MKQMKRNSRLEMKREEKERREGGREGRKGKRKGREKIIKTLSKQKGRSGHEIITTQTYLTTSYYKISYHSNKTQCQIAQRLLYLIISHY